MISGSNGDPAVPSAARNRWTPPKLQSSLLGAVAACASCLHNMQDVAVGWERRSPTLRTCLLRAAGATETLTPKDVIGEELEAPNGFDGEEKNSCKSLPEVLGREEAGYGVCCSWLARAGLEEHPLSTAAKGWRAQGEEPAGVAGRGLSPRSPSEVASGLCPGCVSSLAAVPAWRRGGRRGWRQGGQCGMGGRGEMCSWMRRRREMGTRGHGGGIWWGMERSLGVWGLHSSRGSDAAGVKAEMGPCWSQSQHLSSPTCSLHPWAHPGGAGRAGAVPPRGPSPHSLGALHPHGRQGKPASIGWSCCC